MKKHRYFDSTGQEVDPATALDRGVLRDGFSLRVPTTLRDSARSQDAKPLITDGTDNPLGLNRPGWRIMTGDAGQKVADAYRDRDEAYRDYENQLTAAYRARTDAKKRRGDEDDDDDNEHEDGSIKNFGSNNHSTDGQSLDQHRQMMDRLYRERDEFDANAWRRG